MNYYPLFIALLSALLFGIATPLSKSILYDVGPFTLAGFLYIGASLGLLPYLIARKKLRLPARIDRRTLLLVSGSVVMGGIAGPVLLFLGLMRATAASVSLWLNFELVATSLLGFLFFKEHIGMHGIAGIALALASGVVLTIHGSGSASFAALLVGLACLCWGLDNHLTTLIDGISPLQSTFIKGLAAGTVNIIIGLFMNPAVPRATSMIIMLSIGIFSYGVSSVFYIISAQKIGATRAQIIFSSAPFWGLLLAAVMLSEPVLIQHIISLLLMVLSIVFMAIERHEHLHEHHAMIHAHFHRHDDLHHEPDAHKPELSHGHEHQHERTSHSHPHWPDIHHRHDHR